MEDIAVDYLKADITNSEKFMLNYAHKLTKEPSSIRKRDIDILVKAGFSERDIFDINQVTAYFNYVNRVTDGLGVTLD